jgi:hypothetical protein
LIGSYLGFIERKYSTSGFKTDESTKISFEVTDPCVNTQLSKYQTFFTAHSDPYFYVIGETSPIDFDLTAGYTQDSISAGLARDYFCGYPTFGYKVELYPDGDSTPENSQKWLEIVQVPNEASSYDSKNVILSIKTTDAQQNGIYFVYTKIVVVAYIISLFIHQLKDCF